MGYGLIVEKRQDGIERRGQQFHKKNVLQFGGTYFYYLDCKLIEKLIQGRDKNQHINIKTELETVT